MPTGSSSYSHSTVFSKTSRLSIQSYHPGYNVHDYPGPEDSVKSPSMKSQSSISDLRDFFSNSSVAEKWTQRKCNQYHERCKSIDNKFGDVCTTPILTARSHHNARTESMRRRKGAVRLSSASSSIYGKSGMVTEFSSSVLDNASIVSSSTMDEPTPLPPISPYPHTVQQQRRHNTESMIFKLLQRNSSFVSLCSSRESLPPLNLTRRNKFFGKIVEKFGQIGGPKYSRHMESEISSPMSTKSFVQRNTSEHSFGSKKKVKSKECKN